MIKLPHLFLLWPRCVTEREAQYWDATHIKLAQTWGLRFVEVIRENAHGRRCLRREPANLSLERISLQGLARYVCCSPELD